MAISPAGQPDALNTIDAELQVALGLEFSPTPSECFPMLMRQFALPCMLLTASVVSQPAQTAQAGPLLDWLFHRPAYGPAVPVGSPYPVAAGYAPAMPYNTGYVPYSTGYAPYTSGYRPYATGYAPTTPYPTPYTTGYSGYSGYTPYGVAYPSTPSTGYRPTIGNVSPQSSYPVPSYGTYYGSNSPVIGANGYGYLTQKPPNNVIATTPTVMPPTAPVTLVPDYRSTYARTPVTYYRPVLTTDPNTGSQVVALAPCSSYEYQTQRVPTWGLSQVYNGGATLPAVTPTAPVVSPTISLPRGGIPLAGPVPGTQPYATAYGAYPSMATSTITPVAPTMGSVITPASPYTNSSPTPYTSGYSNYASNYGNYSALQPGTVLPPGSAYPTTPYNPYYGNGVSGGSTGGGSTGGGSLGTTFAPPAYNAAPYGSSVPQGGMIPYGTTTSPSLTTPIPSTPSTTPNINPPANFNFPSNDPAANTNPVLPPNNTNSSINKPQLQNYVQQPMPSTRSFNPSSAPAASKESQPTAESSQGLLPIPVPDDFKHEPRWNPGLLKEQDTTAAITRDIDPQIAWGAKTIHWASHKTSTGRNTPEIPLPPATLRDQPTPKKFTPPVTEIPEVNFQPPQPARLDQPADPQVDPLGRRTDVWKKAK